MELCSKFNSNLMINKENRFGEGEGGFQCQQKFSGGTPTRICIQKIYSVYFYKTTYQNFIEIRW